MKKSKNFLRMLMLSVLVLLTVVSAAFAASCGGDDEKEEDVTAVVPPQNITYDGALITWDAVPGADHYTVAIDGGTPHNTVAPSYAFNANGGEFSVRITAINKKGEEATEQNFTMMPKITELRVSDSGELSWDPVENASGYLVVIGSGAAVKTANTFYNDLPEGQNTVKVRPVGTSASYYSMWTTKTVNRLGRIDTQKLVYDGDAIRWQSISGALGYEITINGEVTEELFKGTRYTYNAGTENFTVSVRAIGNHSSSFDGQASEEKRFVYLETVSRVEVKDGIVIWDEVPDASSYKMKVNGTELSVTFPANDRRYTKLVAGNPTEIQVLPQSTDTAYFSSWSSPITVCLLASPKIVWNNALQPDGEAKNNITWDAVTGADGYTAKIASPDGNTEEIPLVSSARSLSYAFPLAGEYTVSIKANADKTDDTMSDSSYSSPVVVTRLAPPTLQKNGGIVSVADRLANGFTVNLIPVSGAVGYRYYKNGSNPNVSAKSTFRVTDVVGQDQMAEVRINYSIQAIGKQPETVGEKTYVWLDSLTADSLSFEITVLAMPTDLDIDGFGFTYSQIVGAAGYTVTVGGIANTSADTTFNLDNAIREGSAVVNVCANGNGSTTLASNYTAGIRVYRIASPTDIRIDMNTDYGVLKFATEANTKATTYQIVFDNDVNNAMTVSGQANVLNRITEQGTTVYVVAQCNSFNNDRTEYYMNSLPSGTVLFMKLAQPTAVRFDRDNLTWTAPDNLNVSEFSPTYEIVDSTGTVLGRATSLTMAIERLAMEGGNSYEVQIRAIGDGEKYVTSEYSVVTDASKAYKIEKPSVSKVGNGYQWHSVAGAESYTVIVDGEIMQNAYHVSGDTYIFNPGFTLPNRDYRVQIIAVGNSGTASTGVTVSSFAWETIQHTVRLATPEFTIGYSEDHYDLNGEIIIRLKSEVAGASAYAYTIGGGAQAFSDQSLATEFRKCPGTTGVFVCSVTAKGSVFDSEGNYLVDSLPAGGNASTQIILLSVADVTNITISRDGMISWSRTENAVGYDLWIDIDGAGYGEKIELKNSTYTIPDYDYKTVGTVRIKLVARGNGTTIISSAEVEKTVKS